MIQSISLVEAVVIARDVAHLTAVIPRIDEKKPERIKRPSGTYEWTQAMREAQGERLRLRRRDPIFRRKIRKSKKGKYYPKLSEARKSYYNCYHEPMETKDQG